MTVIYYCAAALLTIVVPLTVVLVGAKMLFVASNRKVVLTALEEYLTKSDRVTLNKRVVHYDLEAVAEHWSVLDNHTEAAKAETVFLKLDLFYPVCYCLAFSVSLVYSWIILNKAFNIEWLLIMVTVLLMSDWTENLIQLKQLNKYFQQDKSALDSFWISVASVATRLKLMLFASVFLGVAALSLCVAIRCIAI